MALLCLTIGCTKTKFTLEFVFPAAYHSTFNISYYSADKTDGKWIETALMVQKGNSKGTLPLTEPTVMSLSSAGNTIYIYAEPGNKITIKGDSSDLLSWNVTGNSINDQWTEWRHANRQDLSSGDAEKINNAISKYVKAHPEEALSALLLLYEFDRSIDNSGFLKLWKSLKGDAAMEKWITLSGRTDLYKNTPVTPVDQSKPHKFVLKSLVNGADTIVTGKVPVTLLFWRNSDNNRSEMIDSLRRLRKEHPDSSSYIIADICFDPDSLSWTTPLAHDSLKQIIRAWNPVAEADSISRILGVERTPMIVTLNPINKKASAKNKKN